MEIKNLGTGHRVCCWNKRGKRGGLGKEWNGSEEIVVVGRDAGR